MIYTLRYYNHSRRVLKVLNAPFGLTFSVKKFGTFTFDTWIAAFNCVHISKVHKKSENIQYMYDRHESKESKKIWNTRHAISHFRFESHCIIRSFLLKKYKKPIPNFVFFISRNGVSWLLIGMHAYAKNPSVVQCDTPMEMRTFSELCSILTSKTIVFLLIEADAEFQPYTRNPTFFQLKHWHIKNHAICTEFNESQSLFWDQRWRGVFFETTFIATSPPDLSGWLRP